MAQTTKRESDGEHPSSHYLVVEDPQVVGTWHLPVRNADGTISHTRMGQAWAALHGGSRGQKYEGPNKQQALEELTKLYEKENLPLPGVSKEYSAMSAGDGIMVCLKPSPGVAAAMAFAMQQTASGQQGWTLPADDLHITLAYLGSTEEVTASKESVLAALQGVASAMSPFLGYYSGMGVFSPKDQGVPLYTNLDSPALPALRSSVVQALEGVEAPVDLEHGFTPHMTLAYLPGYQTLQVPLPPPIPDAFNSLYLVWGEETIPVPLGNSDSKSLGVSKMDGRLSVSKGLDGRLRWVLLSSSNYNDKHREIVSAAALEKAAARMNKRKDHGPLRWWHLGDPDPITGSPGMGVDLGYCDFSEVVDGVLVESGTFYDEEVGGMIMRSKEELGASISFWYDPRQASVSAVPGFLVYHDVDIYERSLLPEAAAANPYTALI